MNIYVLFVQRVETRPGQYAPEAVTAVDEQSLDEVSLAMLEDEYVEGWNTRFADDVDDFDTVFTARAWVKVELSRSAQEIRDYLKNPMTVKGYVAATSLPKGSHPSYGGITVTQGREGGKIQDSEILD